MVMDRNELAVTERPVDEAFNSQNRGGAQRTRRKYDVVRTRREPTGEPSDLGAGETVSTETTQKDARGRKRRGIRPKASRRGAQRAKARPQQKSRTPGPQPNRSPGTAVPNMTPPRQTAQQATAEPPPSRSSSAHASAQPQVIQPTPQRRLILALAVGFVAGLFAYWLFVPEEVSAPREATPSVSRDEPAQRALTHTPPIAQRGAEQRYSPAPQVTPGIVHGSATGTVDTYRPLDGVGSVAV